MQPKLLRKNYYYSVVGAKDKGPSVLRGIVRNPPGGLKLFSIIGISCFVSAITFFYGY
jgi:hypothetical protein